MVTGETHYFLGCRYRLRVVLHDAPGKVFIRSRSFIDLHVRPGSGSEARARVMQSWYRQQLKTLIPPLLQRWEKRLNIQASDWAIKKMKTKWGTCNADARRIWLNLELAKKPVQCLEYILVHELVHLLERHHNERFISIMNRHLPQWRSHRQLLNSEPLAHDTWSY